VCIYIGRASSRISSWLSSSSSFRANTAKKEKRNMLGGSGGGGGFSAAITAAVIPLFIGCAIAGDGRSFDV
jgi:hypothetical protein